MHHCALYKLFQTWDKGRGEEAGKLCQIEQGEGLDQSRGQVKASRKKWRAVEVRCGTRGKKRFQIELRLKMGLDAGCLVIT